MRILFVCRYLPYPPNNGSKMRDFNVIKRLSARHTVDLFAFVDDAIPSQDLVEMSKYCRSIKVVCRESGWTTRRSFTLFKNLLSIRPFIVMERSSPKASSELHAFTGEGQYDVIQFEKLEMAQYVDSVAGKPALILDQHNIETDWTRSYIAIERNPVIKLYLYLQWLKIRFYEPGICSKFHCCFTVTRKDAQRLEGMLGGRTRITPILTGIDVDYYQPCNNYNNVSQDILFIGSMHMRPNVEAVMYFAREVLPKIRRKIPEATFTIVGRSPKPQVRMLAEENPSIRVTGEVDDVRPFIRKSAVVVNPIHHCGGVKTKVLEAMAMGKAVVSTTAGIEGIEVIPDTHLVVADDPDNFAQAVADLLRDPAYRREFELQARQVILEKYDYDKIVDELDHVYSDLLSSHSDVIA